VEVPDDDLLSTSPFDGDLAEELAAAPPKQRGRPSATVILATGVLLVGGFLGGIQADKHWGAQKAPNASDIVSQLARRGAQGGGGGLAGGGGGFGGGGAFGGAGQGQQAGGLPGGRAGTSQGGGSATTGTVKLVDGDTIYVQTANGIVRVKTTGSTKVTIAKKAKPKDLKAGSSVTVQGPAGQDGTVTATSVAQGK
jgi:hypothetical protein